MGYPLETLKYLKNYYKFKLKGNIKMKLADLLYKKDDGIAYITINRPESFNSLRLQTFDELLMIIDDLDNDNTIGVVVIQGAGNKAFCSGVDVETLKGMSEFPEHLIRKFTKKAIQMVNGLLLLDKPTIAAVKGYSSGFGHELRMLSSFGSNGWWYSDSPPPGRR